MTFKGTPSWPKIVVTQTDPWAFLGLAPPGATYVGHINLIPIYEVDELPMTTPSTHLVDSPVYTTIKTGKRTGQRIINWAATADKYEEEAKRLRQQLDAFAEEVVAGNDRVRVESKARQEAQTKLAKWRNAGRLATLSRWFVFLPKDVKANVRSLLAD